MMKFRNPILTALLAAALFACDNGGELDNPENISNEEQAELVANSLSSDISSVTSDLGTTGFETVDALTNGRSEQSRIQCGETVTETFSNTFEGDFVTFNFQATYTTSLTCILGVPILLEAEISSSSNAESARLMTSGALDGDIVVSLDDENLGNYLMNATLARTGQLTQRQGEQRSFSTASTITITDLSISTAYIVDRLQGETPTSNLIAGGSATYSVTGTGSGGGEFSFMAAITFLGDGTAEIVINARLSLSISILESYYKSHTKDQLSRITR